MEKKGQLLALPPSCWGSELVFGTSTRSLRSWEEGELGIQDSLLELGFFLSEERP